MDLNTTYLMTLDSPIERAASIFAIGLITLFEQHGIYVTLFAFMGFICLINTTIKQFHPVFMWIAILFIATPLIIIKSKVDKKYGSVMVGELSDMKLFMKHNPKAKWDIIKYVGGLFILLCVLIVACYVQCTGVIK